MRTWRLTLFDNLRSSFWFVPAVMGLIAACLALLLVVIDVRYFTSDQRVMAWLNVGDADGVRNLLAAILAASITVLTVIFSITVVALTLASTQLGPRMLWTFMEDRGTQFVLGTFVASCVYCLLVLCVIGRFEGDNRVPHLAALGAQALAVFSLGVLVYFMHHIATAIQAPEVVAEVSREVDRAIDRWYPNPERLTKPIGLDELVRLSDQEPFRLAAHHSNYIQALDYETLVGVAERADLVVRMKCRPGDFVVKEGVLLEVFPAERVTSEVAEAMREVFILGTQRTPTQDIEFTIDQLAEIAVRAMSPAINDPFTAMAAIDRLAAGLCRLCDCHTPQRYHLDRHRRLRVVAVASTFKGIVDAAFDKIRQFGRGHASVMIHLLEALYVVGAHARHEHQREAIRRQAAMVMRGVLDAVPEEEDRRDARERYERLLRTLGDGVDPPEEAEAAAPAALRA